MRASERQAELQSLAEQSYDQLKGDWLIWYQVARRFEHKAKAQDRGDLRHTIILRLAQVAKSQSKTLTEPTMYRVASYVVARGRGGGFAPTPFTSHATNPISGIAQALSAVSATS